MHNYSISDNASIHFKGVVQTVMFCLCFGVLKLSNAHYSKLVCFLCLIMNFITTGHNW